MLILILLSSILIANYGKRRKLTLLERMGWVSTIAAFFLLATTLTPNSPLVAYQSSILIVSILLIMGSGLYSFVERFMVEPRIMLQPFNEENVGVTEFRFVLQGRNKRFPHLQIQASYGWGSRVTLLQRLRWMIRPPPEKTTHTAWFPLDLRDFSPEELVRGKSGQPAREIALEQHDLKRCSFVTFYAQEKRARFAVTEEPIHGAVFSNAILVTPNPEIVAKFIGLPRATVKKYVAVYNSPPWGPDRRAVDLIDASKRKAKHVIFEREKMLGRIGTNDPVTVFEKLPDGVIAQVTTREIAREILGTAKRVN
jgi:hypothetical protein